MQVVFVRALDPHGRDLAQTQRAAACHIDRAVDLGCVASAAALGDRGACAPIRHSALPRVDLVDDHLLAGAHLALETTCRNRLLVLHEAIPTLLLHLARDQRRKVVRNGAFYRLVTEAADAIELRLIEPVQQELKNLIALAPQADDEGGAGGEGGAGW